MFRYGRNIAGAGTIFRSSSDDILLGVSVDRRRRELLETLRSVLHRRAFTAPASEVAQVVEEVRADLHRFRFDEYTLVWAGRHELPPALAISALLMDPPEPLSRVELPIAHVTQQLMSEAEARAILEQTVRFDQAWRVAVCTEAQAGAIVDRVFGPLDRPACWTSTGMAPQTFDRGVVAADAEHVLVVWLGDED